MVQKWTVFTKTGETSLDRFDRFLVNRLVNLKILKKLKIFEIFFWKQTRADFKIFVKTKFKNSKWRTLQNSVKVKQKENREKKENDQFLIRGQS
jgi:hypothetical protein